VAIRDMGAFRFNNALSSFRLGNVSLTDSVTLVLFSGLNFQGAVRVFRGAVSVANLRSFNNVTSSMVLVGRNLTNAEIRAIRRTGTPPRDVLVIRQ